MTDDEQLAIDLGVTGAGVSTLLDLLEKLLAGELAPEIAGTTEQTITDVNDLGLPTPNGDRRRVVGGEGVGEGGGGGQKGD